MKYATKPSLLAFASMLLIPEYPIFATNIKYVPPDNVTPAPAACFVQVQVLMPFSAFPVVV